MKVWLVNPPAADGVELVREGRCMQRKGAWTAVWPPLSLALTAACLEKERIEVKLNDCIVEHLGFNRLKDIVRDFAPQLIIINTATPSIKSDLSTVRQIKSISPGIKMAAIGIHVSALPEDSFKLEPDLDFIIRGEPELTIRQLALSLRENLSLSEIKGISYKQGNQIQHNPQREFLSDLDKLPFPAWHLINRQKYIMPFKNKPFLLVPTARGCPYKCSFCADSAYYGSKLRLRTPGRIADEIEWIEKRFKINEFLFWSESFTINNNFVMELCREFIERGLKIGWVANSRVDNVNPELLNKMKEAGCWMIGYGIESASRKILDSVNKGITLAQTKEAVILAKEAGLEVTGHCILGLPGETRESLRETINFAIELELDFAQFYCAVPFPGSALYNLSKEKQWINTADWSRFEQNQSVLDTAFITADEIMALRREAFRKFYLRPKTIFKNFKRVKSFSDAGYVLRMIKDFSSWF